MTPEPGEDGAGAPAGLVARSPRCRSARDRVDAVVIGAGAGGLAAAVRLAADGRRVLVCEQDRHVGGTAHVFRRGGFVFPAGPLSFTVPGFLGGALCDLGVTEPVEFERDVFQVRRGDMDVIISAPLARVAEQLTRCFPAEQAGIAAVTSVLSEITAALHRLEPDDLTAPSPWAAHPPPPRPSEGRPASAQERRDALDVVRRWGGVRAVDLLARHIRDRRLRDLVGSQGTSEPTMPVVLLAQMWDFMAERGIWYPRDGIGAVGELLARRLHECGGDIRRGVRVTRVRVDSGRATGVVLDDGTEIEAGAVISDADYRHALLELVPAEALDPAAAGVVAGLPLTSSVFAVFLGVRADQVDLAAFRGHQLLVKLEEGAEVPWARKRPTAEDFVTDELWLCWWSRHPAQRVWAGESRSVVGGPVSAALGQARDEPSRESLAPAGHETLVIKVMAPVAPFMRLDGEGRRRHDPAYYVLKEQMADALVEAAERVLPGLSGSAVVREVATPLTYRDWGHRSEGSVAGWSWRAGDVPEPWAQDLVQTPLPGLLAVGLQSHTRLLLGGLGTSLHSGLKAARIALDLTR